MADDVRRWSVTYTKHVKQKRKVYQDGFLELRSSSHKVTLYDDCDKLLDSKIVKLDDAVRSGETLTFGAYLVDIGDPDRDSKPISNSILQRREKIIADKNGMLNSKSSKSCSRMSKASSINLSPSQKIIREFKRREVDKYCSSPGCPDKVKTNLTEWQVLYTTQLTQKNKKFHDGILSVSNSGSQGKQVMLYDATRRLLDSRFLKKDEVIMSGVSLTFDGYLVDIGELGDCKPLTDVNVEGRNCYVQNTPKQKIHNKNIAVFKKSETSNFSATASSPDTSTKPDSIEWSVLYTTQLTQKAKKFHDGILQLTSCGLQGRQVMLYDATRRLLNSRFLKKNESVKSGESLTFDGHLVDIGEIEGPVPLVDLNVEGRNCEEAAQSEGKPKTHNNNPVEWDAMYTTQVNQKSKKYHSGIIRLASCGSYRMQATLLSEDGITLSRRYLKLSEDINGGSLFNMPNYLVEVGEPRKPSEGERPWKLSTSENESPNIGSFEVDNIKLCKRIPFTRPQSDGEPPKRASSLQYTDLNLRNSVADDIISTTINNDKPLRDARMIFSFLKKPSTQEGIVALEEEPHVSQSSASVQTGIPHQVEGLQGSCSRPEAASYNEEASKLHDYSEAIVKCESVETIRSANSDSRAEMQQKYYTEYDFSFRLETSVVSEPYVESTEAVDVGGHPEVVSSKAPSSINEPANEVQDQRNSYEEFRGAYKLENCIHHDDSNERSFEDHTNSKIGELPTFDLGFE